MIDTHTHLNFRAFTSDYKEVIARAQKAGIQKMVVVGAKIDSSQRALIIAKNHTNCYAAVGIHPHHAHDYLRLGEEFVAKQIRSLIKQVKVVAIGETGLDYFRYKNALPLGKKDTDLQKSLLFLHLQIAKGYRLPLILHCREAFPDLLRFLVQSFKRLKYQPKGVFHCFSGTKEDLLRVLKMGFYVGFDGNSTYENNHDLRERIVESPLERILLETDSPFLTPEPLRGQRNEPKNLGIVARLISQVKKIPLQEIEKNTTRNALSLFMLK